MNAQLAYLETEVATACPPKLRLLLIDAALRLARQSRSSDQSRFSNDNRQSLGYLKKIILQLLMSLDRQDNALAGKIKGVYMYLFCTVVEAELTADIQKLCEVERILQIERETWQILTDRYLAEAASE
jgi:flagellar biosynthetic protein FliS